MHTNTKTISSYVPGSEGPRCTPVQPGVPTKMNVFKMINVKKYGKMNKKGMSDPDKTAWLLPHSPWCTPKFGLSPVPH